MVFPTKSIIDSADKQRKNKTHRVPAFFFGSLLGLLFVSVLRFARRVPDPSRNSHRLLCFFDFNSAAVIHNGLPLERTEFFPKLFRPPFCDVPGIKVTRQPNPPTRGRPETDQSHASCLSSAPSARNRTVSALSGRVAQRRRRDVSLIKFGSLHSDVYLTRSVQRSVVHVIALSLTRVTW